MVRSLPDFIAVMVAFIVGITFHEWGHAWMATQFGDETPRKQGRVTLNPLDHLDPWGTLFIALVSLGGPGFGWGRPVQTVPLNYTSMRWGSFWVAAMGPIMSFATALGFAIVERFNLLHLPSGSPFHDILLRCVDVNVLLFLFNPLPVPPLDGSKMVSAFLDADAARKYDKVLQIGGMLAFVAIVATGAPFIKVPMQFIALFLLGPDYTYNNYDPT